MSGRDYARPLPKRTAAPMPKMPSERQRQFAAAQLTRFANEIQSIQVRLEAPNASLPTEARALMERVAAYLSLAAHDLRDGVDAVEVRRAA